MTSYNVVQKACTHFSLNLLLNTWAYETFKRGLGKQHCIGTTGVVLSHFSLFSSEGNTQCLRSMGTCVSMPIVWICHHHHHHYHNHLELCSQSLAMVTAI